MKKTQQQNCVPVSQILSFTKKQEQLASGIC